MQGESLLNQYFDDVMYLTAKHRPERDLRMQEELKKWDIAAERFEAYDFPNARTSFNISMMHMLKEFLRRGHHRLLILEDDVVFQNMSTIHKSLQQLDFILNWDMFYLGANTWTFPVDVQSENLVRVRGAWTTHACSYTRASAQKIVEQFDPMSELVYDDWLAHSFHPVSNCFLAWPMCAVQQPNYSDLLQQDVDYHVCWQNTNNRISRAMKAHKIKQAQNKFKIHR